ncbi:37S ribosomal protein S24, mitochondrial [Aspergillus hancockii]|nr:37S ribosomal protein S24, mitochondrial [Aspergillus hancockii]
MASAARHLGRSALSVARRGSIAIPYRSFSATTPSFISEDPPVPPTPREPRPEELPAMPEYSPDLLTPSERSMYDMMSPEDQKQFDAENRRIVENFNNPAKRAAAFAEIEKRVAHIDKKTPMRFEETREKRLGFWGEEEDDEFALVPDADEQFNDDDITSAAHAELEVHREVREYARIAAWDMPMLSQLAQPFSLPPQTHILRFRYTTYMGEEHPAESKVVVELSSKDLAPKYLSEAQRQTFLKLVGPRYNPDTDIVRMSCEKFPNRAQNKRYLGDIINTLIKEAKDGDAFADVPLDLRHHKPKPKLQFPDSWKMTEERKKQIAAHRAERKRLEQERAGIVDGKAVISEAAKVLPALNPALRALATEEREKVAVRVSGKAQKKRLR